MATGAGSAASDGPATAWSSWLWILLLAVAFVPALLSLVEVWHTVDYYGHGLAIPVFSAASFLALRRQLGPPSEARSGFALIASALALYLLGLGFGDATLQGLALVTAVAGVVVTRWGWPGLRKLSFPVGFLLFMVPLPAAVVTPFILFLQSWVSALSSWLLGVGGFAVLREGNVLVLPGGERLFVAEACSGITSIITLVPLGVLVAYYTEKRWVQRLLVVAAVVPLAMLGNLLRVVVTVVAAERVGTEVATTGTVHELTGIAAFALACLGLLGMGRLLRALSPERSSGAGPGPAAPRP